MPKEGSDAPDFTLPDGEGKPWRLSDYRGKVIVLLFYPGDETPICTRQMCSEIRTQVAAASIAFSDEVN
jgi:thioredoxin-dependent peroxiredoxin